MLPQEKCTPIRIAVQIRELAAAVAATGLHIGREFTRRCIQQVLEFFRYLIGGFLDARRPSN